MRFLNASMSAIAACETTANDGAFEFAGPLVQRLDGLGIRLIEHLAAVAAHPNETDLAKDAQMLGGRLL
jgi:hypothetical protein